ncbi:hypothetical protein Gpo141_00003957 [Globisporangium polare]
MDHHCVWVNNCVGIGNHKFFQLFSLYTCVISLYGSVLSVLWYFTPGGYGDFKGEENAAAESLGFYEVVGGASEQFAIAWLLPVNIWFPVPLKTRILGSVLEEELYAPQAKRAEESEMEVVVDGSSLPKGRTQL